jgi:16S rRNA (adenine1518-N6/adenine1519-N6)-dimethyltransferase
MARQRLGQHFLSDEGWREEIARAIRVSPQSIGAPPSGNSAAFCWIEIGAGHGEMTEHLASTGAPVHAIELDPLLAAALKRLAKRFPNLEIVSADILETEIEKMAAGRRVRIYGNLPYYITSPILHRLFESAEIIDEIHIVIQHEVALRLAAQPGTRDYGYLSVLTQYFSRPELVLEIPRGAFRPPPEVSSALVTLRLPGERAKLPQIDEASFLEFVKVCFSQKRKTLVNNLKSRVKPEMIREALANLQLRVDARAEQLSVPNLAALLQQLEGHLQG